MLDIKFIRENKDVISMGATKKRINFDVEKLLQVDDKRREILAKVEAKRAEQNEVGTRISSAGEAERADLLKQMTELKENLQKEEAELKEIMKEWQSLMLQVPNIPDMSVPDGDDDSSNQELRIWGEKPQFDFTPKNHIDLMTSLDLADFERGTDIAGFRGYVLKNDAVLLQFALQQFVLDKIVSKGFSPLIVPSLVRKETLLGTGYLPQGEDDLYKTQDEDFLAGTGEVATMSYYADQTLHEKDLPIKFIAYSPCFRREAGSHGKDAKGLIRVHEFYKLELVVLCEANHESSVKWHEELLQIAEEIMQDLKIPYHVVVNCGGDLGLGQVKKYDIEAWNPSENAYRETHSDSYFHDFQSRRLNIRYKGFDDKKYFVHSLNSTAIAFPRILVPILENNQQADGTIKIPEVLQPYMQNREIIGKIKE